MKPSVKYMIPTATALLIVVAIAALIASETAFSQNAPNHYQHTDEPAVQAYLVKPFDIPNLTNLAYMHDETGVDGVNSSHPYFVTTAYRDGGTRAYCLWATGSPGETFVAHQAGHLYSSMVGFLITHQFSDADRQRERPTPLPTVAPTEAPNYAESVTAREAALVASLARVRTWFPEVARTDGTYLSHEPHWCWGIPNPSSTPTG